MANNPTLHIVAHKWRTPNHSSRKEFDDSHETKKKILKRVGKKNFSKQVGSNPDLDIIEGKIILKGVGEYKKKKYYETNIAAEEYFIMRFVSIVESNETEIQILILNSTNTAEGKVLNVIAHFHQMFIIPNNDEIIWTLIETLTKEYIERASGQTEEFIILLRGEQ